MEIISKISSKKYELLLAKVNCDNKYDMLGCVRNAIDELSFNQWGTHILRRLNGAPYLENNHKKISISHSLNVFAILISDNQCGVDIEFKNRDAIKIARKFTNDSEVQIAKTIYPNNPHLLIWCCKEALYKRFSIDGAEFKNDFILKSAKDNNLIFNAFLQEIELSYFEIGNLLVAYC